MAKEADAPFVAGAAKELEAARKEAEKRAKELEETMK